MWYVEQQALNTLAKTSLSRTIEFSITIFHLTEVEFNSNDKLKNILDIFFVMNLFSKILTMEPWKN